MAFIKNSTLTSDNGDGGGGNGGGGGGLLELGLPLGCDPSNPSSPPDGCVGWEGFTDVGNYSMGSVDGQQHVAILLNGTGAPQYRFITGMPRPGTFTLDRPFEEGTAVDGVLVSVDVVKAQNLHVTNFHVDTGHFQFFNGAIDTVVAGNVGERMGGFFTYGQWHNPSPFFHNGWVLSPSYMMQFIGNRVIEGNAVKNYVGGAGMMAVDGQPGSNSFGGGPTANASSWRWQFNGGSVGFITQTAGAPFSDIPSTAFMTFRRNVVENSGGLFLGTSHETIDAEGSGAGGAGAGVPSLGSNFVVEKNVVARSSVCILVNQHFTGVEVRGNICPPNAP